MNSTRPHDPSRPAMFVSGGSRGLGRELVRHFASRFNVVFGWRRSEQEAVALTDEIVRRGDWAAALQLDVREPEELQRASGRFAELAGSCRALIHTPGMFTMTKLDKMNPATWREELDSTVSAAFYCWWAFQAQLTSKTRSRIVFIGDSSAERLHSRSQSIAYHIGKNGLVVLARTIAHETRSFGLTCNVVSPGVMPNSVDLDQPGMHCNVDAREVAGVIDFLLSPAADAISGSNLIASRGWNV